MLDIRMGVDFQSGKTVAAGSVRVPVSAALPATALRTFTLDRLAGPVCLPGGSTPSGCTGPSVTDIAPDDRIALSLHGSAPGSEHASVHGPGPDDSRQFLLPCAHPADSKKPSIHIDQSRPAMPDQAARHPKDTVPAATLFAIDTARPHVAIPHRRAMEVPYGTIAAWIKPDSIQGRQSLVALEESGSGDDGRLRLCMDCDRIALLLSEPYSRKSHAWVTEKPVFNPGIWTHVALTFDHQGATVFVDGAALADRGWCPVAGGLETPSAMVDFSLENTDRPIILGFSEHSAAAGSGGSCDDQKPGFSAMPARAFTGMIAGFALWGGFLPQDALDAAQIGILAGRGPVEEIRADKKMLALNSRPRLPGRSREAAPRGQGAGAGSTRAITARRADLAFETHA